MTARNRIKTVLVLMAFVIAILIVPGVAMADLLDEGKVVEETNVI